MSVRDRVGGEGIRTRVGPPESAGKRILESILTLVLSRVSVSERDFLEYPTCWYSVLESCTITMMVAKVVRLRKQRDTKWGKLVAGMLVSPKCKMGQALNRSSRAAGGTITEVSWVSFSPRLGTSGKVGQRLTPKKYKRGEILLAL